MSKLIYFAALVASLFLIAGSVWFPTDSAMWLASTSMNFVILRSVIAIILVALLITNPPRAYWFRVIVGSTAALLGTWAVVSTYANHMKLADGLLLVVVAISFGLTALEYNLVERSVHGRRMAKLAASTKSRFATS